MQRGAVPFTVGVFLHDLFTGLLSLFFDGGIFRREWWQLWESADGRFPVFDYLVGSLDSAFTEQERNDRRCVDDHAGKPSSS